MKFNLMRHLTRWLPRWLFRPIEPLDAALWSEVMRRYPLFHRLNNAQSQRLARLSAEFLARKNIVDADHLGLDELTRIEIAAQACLPILELGLKSYKGWHDVVIYAGAFRRQRLHSDAAGVVHSRRDVLAGEAWQHGPVVLSLEEVRRAGDLSTYIPGQNVVIHEFAHKLDMLNGNANGFPPLHRGMNAESWRRAFMGAYLDFCQRADEAIAAAPIDGGVAMRDLPFNPYAKENPAEFFAVISECFFDQPKIVAAAYPAVFEQLVAFYRQNPL